MNLEQIHKLAEEISSKYNPDKEAPFPYKNVLNDKSDLNIWYLDLEDDDVSGATLYRNDKFTILINTKKHENRQHFTLGHELGHYFLHQDILKEKNGLIDGDSFLDGNKVLYRIDDHEKRNKIEKEANHFAASLIMPASLVKKAWKANDNIEEIAQIFKVSTLAMSIRLTQLGLVI